MDKGTKNSVGNESSVFWDIKPYKSSDSHLSLMFQMNVPPSASGFSSKSNKKPVLRFSVRPVCKI
jgi:hypothetical protein